MSIESVDEGLEVSESVAEGSDPSGKWIEALEQVSGKLKSNQSAHSKEPDTAECPYCLGDVFVTASHCKGCGNELVQYLAALRLVQAGRYEAENKVGTPEQATIGGEVSNTVDQVATQHPPMLGFMYAAAMPSLLFVALSYLTLWGTRLKTSEWGPITLVVGVFVLCASIGASHVRDSMGERHSKWHIALWGSVLGIWVALLQTALQYLLDSHLPTEREEYFELLNAVLGGLFAYVSGAAIPIAQKILGHGKTTLGGVIEVLWRIRFSLLSGVFSLLIGFLK